MGKSTQRSFGVWMQKKKLHKKYPVGKGRHCATSNLLMNMFFITLFFSSLLSSTVLYFMAYLCDCFLGWFCFPKLALGVLTIFFTLSTNVRPRKKKHPRQKRLEKTVIFWPATLWWNNTRLCEIYPHIWPKKKNDRKNGPKKIVIRTLP